MTLFGQQIDSYFMLNDRFNRVKSALLGDRLLQLSCFDFLSCAGRQVSELDKIWLFTVLNMASMFFTGLVVRFILAAFCFSLTKVKRLKTTIKTMGVINVTSSIQRTQQTEQTLSHSKLCPLAITIGMIMDDQNSVETIQTDTITKQRKQVGLSWISADLSCLQRWIVIKRRLKRLILSRWELLALLLSYSLLNMTF